MFFAYIASFRNECQIIKVWQISSSGQEYELETSINGKFSEVTKFFGTFTELVAFLSDKGFTLR